MTNTIKVTLYIQPGAKKTELAGEHDGMPKLRIAAPPVDGAANKAVVEFVADYLSLPKSAVKLVLGEKSRVKTIEADVSKLKDPALLKDLLPK